MVRFPTTLSSLILVALAAGAWAQDPATAPRPDQSALFAKLQNNALPKEERLSALRQIVFTDGTEVPRLLAIAADPKQDDDLRYAAMSWWLWHTEGRTRIITSILNEDENGGPELKTKCANLLNRATGRGYGLVPIAEDHWDALRPHINNKDKELRQAVITCLVKSGDTQTIQTIEAALADPKKAVVSADEAIGYLQIAEIWNKEKSPDRRGLYRQFLNDKNPANQAAALGGLYGDEASRQQRLALLNEREQSTSVRRTAMNSLLTSKAVFSQLLAIARNDEEPVDLRWDALNAMIGIMNYPRDREPTDKEQVEFARLLDDLAAGKLGQQFVGKIAEVKSNDDLRRIQGALKSRYSTDFPVLRDYYQKQAVSEQRERSK